jgi:hypothetical protein
MKLVSTLNVVNLSSDPFLTTGTDLYFNTASNVYRYYNSGSWTSVLDSSQLVVNTRSNIFEVGGLASSSFTHTLNSEYINGIILNVSSYKVKFVAPANSVDPIPVGSLIKVMRGSPGEVEVESDGNCLVQSPSNIYLTSQWKVATLIKTASNSWVIDTEFPDIY